MLLMPQSKAFLFLNEKRCAQETATVPTQHRPKRWTLHPTAISNLQMTKQKRDMNGK